MNNSANANGVRLADRLAGLAEAGLARRRARAPHRPVAPRSRRPASRSRSRSRARSPLGLEPLQLVSDRLSRPAPQNRRRPPPRRRRRLRSRPGGSRRGPARSPARQRRHGGRRAGQGAAADDGSAERPPVRSFEPSSLGLTVLLPRDARELQARVTWGDYVTEPRLDDAVFLPEAREAAEARGEKPKAPQRNTVDWRRIPREERLPIPLHPGDAPQRIVIPDSAAPMAPGGGLELVVSARDDRDGRHRRRQTRTARGLGLSGQCPPRGAAPFRRRRLLFPGAAATRLRRRASNAATTAPPTTPTDFDERLADLHYRDVCSFAVGHNTSGDWAAPTPRAA